MVELIECNRNLMIVCQNDDIIDNISAPSASYRDFIDLIVCLYAWFVFLGAVRLCFGWCSVVFFSSSLALVIDAIQFNSFTRN